MNAAKAILPLQIPRLTTDEVGPAYDESALFGLMPGDVFKRLSRLDWSFTNDETGFLAHDIHPYPAKFIPQLPGTLIAALSARGELVMDCFGGSGTTALEAVRLGRRALSIDANPLSAIIGRVKTANLGEVGMRELHGLQSALAAELQPAPDPIKLMTRYASHAPVIPNRDKWFADTSFAELCLIRGRIAALDDSAARDIALVTLSRIALRASFQDSETRYKSVIRDVPPGETLRRYLKEFRSVMDGVAENEPAVRYGDARFLCADVLRLDEAGIADGSVDLIVSSPPYGNATDYHLYHRFRLMWLGFDPVALGKVEIGSHLKHQRESSGFESYYSDLSEAVEKVARVLRPGRYAAFILGDSVYEKQRYDPAEKLREDVDRLGFDACHVIERPIHTTRRSFAHAGRRLMIERIVVMRRKPSTQRVTLEVPPYKLWPYEKKLRLKEAQALDRTAVCDPSGMIALNIQPSQSQLLRSLVFTHHAKLDDKTKLPTWQAILENGNVAKAAAHKDPKYVTHGLHAYKGKFYPQLAKALLNTMQLHEGARVLDPFCGSGTTLLESYLNGFEAFGCDMNPIAAKIARAKTEILQTDPDILQEAVAVLTAMIDKAPAKLPSRCTEFPEACLEEIGRWFAEPVTMKINWLLRAIRKISAGVVRDFFEVVLSGIIRDVSQQDPTDLRVRYRKALLYDADVFGLYRAQLETQFSRIENFWKAKAWAPWHFHAAHAIEGDNRDQKTFDALGIEPRSVDMVLTSPPYGTALPYIDTDRLSLLTIMGLTSGTRRPIEAGLIGSRELTAGQRRRIDDRAAAILPARCTSFIREIQDRLDKDKEAGFRKRNMPALTARYLLDMKDVFDNLHKVCKPGANAMIIIGDNRMEIAGRPIVIPTTDLVACVAEAAGFSEVERLDISVTTENMQHLKNAITENVVMRLRNA